MSKNVFVLFILLSIVCITSVAAEINSCTTVEACAPVVEACAPVVEACAPVVEACAPVCESCSAPVAIKVVAIQGIRERALDRRLMRQEIRDIRASKRLLPIKVKKTIIVERNF